MTDPSDRKGGRLVITGCKFEDCHTAVYGRGLREFNSNGNTFVNVGQPYDVEATKATVTGTRIVDNRNRHERRAAAAKGKSMVGYVGSRAPALPAMCPRCNHIFPSRQYNVRSPRFQGIDNEEPCPECKAPDAKLAEGIFDLADEAVRIIKAEKLTFAMMTAIGAIAQEFVSGNTPVRVASSQIAAISPAFGEIFDKWAQRGSAIAGILGFFVACFALYLQMQANDLAAPAGPQEHHQPYNYPSRIQNAAERALEAASRQAYSLKPAGDAGGAPSEAETEEKAPMANGADQSTEKTGSDHNSANLPKKGPVPKKRPPRR